jgi:hypothetical protein
MDNLAALGQESAGDAGSLTRRSPKTLFSGTLPRW